jgi:hypothetical protein
MNKLRRFLQLSRVERGWLLRAMLWVLGIDLLLNLRGFHWVQTHIVRLGRSAASRKGVSSLAWSVDQVERCVCLVRSATTHHLYPMHCLTRALTAQALLAREGVDAELRIGVQRAGAQVEAHAWLEYQGRPVGERNSVLDTFAVLAQA